jgi:phosphoesterase RecJ-like protein
MSEAHSTEPGQVLKTKPQDEAWEAAVELIRRSTRILLICHVSPDGDAIGSLLGLGLGLRALGKTPTLACESPAPPKFSFLPGFDTIVNTIDADPRTKSFGLSLRTKPFDLVIGLDCSDKARLGKIYNADPPARQAFTRPPDTTPLQEGASGLVGLPLINIDHHITNLYFGDVNLVDHKAASTAEIVLILLDRLGVSTDHDGGSIATCLLTGIVTDTQGFRTSNVTPRVMEAAVRLMEAGASLSEVTHHAFGQRPLVELSLLAQGLSRMQVEGALAWSEITLAARRACGHKGSSDAGLVGMLVRTKEIHMAAVFAEKENSQVEIRFRADPGFDVAQLALSLGGGGHPAASGCTIDGSLEAAKARVLPMLRAALKEQSKGSFADHV